MIPVTAFGGRETDQNKLMVFKAAECFCYTKQRTLNARIGEPMVDLDWSSAYQDYQKISGWQVGTRTREGFSGKYSETKTVTAVHTTWETAPLRQKSGPRWTAKQSPWTKRMCKPF